MGKMWWTFFLGEQLNLPSLIPPFMDPDSASIFKTILLFIFIIIECFSCSLPHSHFVFFLLKLEDCFLFLSSVGSRVLSNPSLYI